MRREGKGRAQPMACFSQLLRSLPWRYAESPTTPTPRGPAAAAGGRGAAPACVAALAHMHASWHGRALRGNSPRLKLLVSSHSAAGPWEGRAGSGRGVKQSTKLPLPTAAKIPGCPLTLRSCSLYVLSGCNRCPLITSLLLDLADKKGHIRQVRSSAVSLLPQPTLKYLSPYLSYELVSLHTKDEI